MASNKVGHYCSNAVKLKTVIIKEIITSILVRKSLC